MHNQETLLVVDGHNLLFQMFFGMPSRIFNQSGRAIHGTLGFIGALNKIIQMVKPTHAVVMFDGEHENDRKEILPSYKANRIDYSLAEEADNPFTQLPDIYRALDYMGIRHTEASDFEADDTIAGYALTYGKDMKIVISSFDSDFFQLINSNVTVLRYRGENTICCDTEYIRNKFHIFPGQYAEFKALVGDTADNIVGVKKIGKVTAGNLLNQFQHLDNLYTHISEVKSLSIQSRLLEEKDHIYENIQLIRLTNRAKLPFRIEELRYADRRYSTTQILKSVGVRD